MNRKIYRAPTEKVSFGSSEYPYKHRRTWALLLAWLRVHGLRVEG